MALPPPIIENEAFGGSSGVLSIPLVAGKKVAVCLSGSGASADPTATVTDNCGTTYTTDIAVRNGTTAATMIIHGDIVNNDTNSSSTITLSGLNFSVEVWTATQFTAASGGPLAVASATPQTSTASMDNTLTFDSQSCGALIFTSAFTGRPTTYSSSGSTVTDQTDLYNNTPEGGDVAISVCQSGTNDGDTTAVTITSTMSLAVTRPMMVSAAYKLNAPDATSITVTSRQTFINQGQKGYVDVAPYPPGTTFSTPVVWTASSTQGASNFIRSDGVMTQGSVSFVGSLTAIMEVRATASSMSNTVVYAWANDGSLSNPSDTSFDYTAAESDYITCTPSVLWNYTAAGSGFATIPTASTVPHGTGYSGIVVANQFDWAWGEYRTTDNRDIALIFKHGDPSNLQYTKMFIENSTASNAINANLSPNGGYWWGPGATFADQDGAYSVYGIPVPVSGLEPPPVEGLIFYDKNGTLPKVASSITDLTSYFTAWATDPLNRVSINTIATNTTITMNFTSTGDTVTIPGSWTSVMPFIIQGASKTTSKIEGDASLRDKVIETDVDVPSVIIKNLTWDASNTGRFQVPVAGALILQDVILTETLPETSKWKGSHNFNPFNNGNHGVYFIGNCVIRSLSLVGMGYFRAPEDSTVGPSARIPNVVVGYDFVQCSDRLQIFGGVYAKRYDNDPALPSQAITSVTLSSVSFAGTSSTNISTLHVSGLPSSNGGEYLVNLQSVRFDSGALSGTSFPAIIGSTNTASGIIYVGGDASGASPGDSISISASFQQRLHAAPYVVVGGATVNGGSTTSILWLDSGDTEQVTNFEHIRFAVNSSTSSVRALQYARNDIDVPARIVTVNGVVPCSAGDQFWFMQEAHADANQLGAQSGQTQNVGPIIEQGYLSEGFQSMLVQPGTTWALYGAGFTNLIAVGIPAQFQQNSSSVHFDATTLVATLDMRTTANLTLADTNASNSIIQGTQADTTWPNEFVIQNSHGVDNAIPGVGSGNTTGSVTYDTYYNATQSALDNRVWFSSNPYDLYRNPTYTEAAPFSKVGAVQSDPSTDQVLTLTGSGSSLVDVESGDFTLTPNAAITGTVTLTSSGYGVFASSGHATDTQQTFTFASSSTPITFTYRPLISEGSTNHILTLAVAAGDITLVGSPVTYPTYGSTITQVSLVAPTVAEVTLSQPLDANDFGDSWIYDVDTGALSVSLNDIVSDRVSLWNVATSPSPWKVNDTWGTTNRAPGINTTNLDFPYVTGTIVAPAPPGNIGPIQSSSTLLILGV